jgi:Glycosyl hydrolase family 81 N-terminal domain
MMAPIVKGMPYATMKYNEWSETDKKGSIIYPTVSSSIELRKNPIIDGQDELDCDANPSKSMLVNREIELLFDQSDFTWLVFFSEPVYVQCGTAADGTWKLQVVDSTHTDMTTSMRSPLYIRAAMYKLCTSGKNPVYCHSETMHPSALLIGQGEYADILRNHSAWVPGANASMHYSVNEEDQSLTYSFDWDVHHLESSLSVPRDVAKEDSGLIMYALPHHFDVLNNVKLPHDQLYCSISILGPACIVQGWKWTMSEDTPFIGFRAPRPPAPWAFESIEKALKADMEYTLPDYFMKGAGDTYFSGKMLAKQARILVVADEMNEICQSSRSLLQENIIPGSMYSDACDKISLPSKADFDKSLHLLKRAVEVWIDGSAVTPFVYDGSCKFWLVL